MVCTSAVWRVSATIAASELILGAGRRIEPRRIEAGGGGPLGVEPRRIAALKLALARCRAAHLSNRGAGGCGFDCILRLLRLRSHCRVGDTEGFHSKITDAPAGKSFQRLPSPEEPACGNPMAFGSIDRFSASCHIPLLVSQRDCGLLCIPASLATMLQSSDRRGGAFQF